VNHYQTDLDGNALVIGYEPIENINIIISRIKKHKWS